MRFLSLFKMIMGIPIQVCRYSANLVILRLNQVKIGEGWKIFGVVYILNEGKINIGHHFLANSAKNSNPIGGDTTLRLVVRRNGSLIIGNHVGISNSTVVCWMKVEIGDYVSIGGGCRIWDTDFHSTDPVDRRHNDNANVKTGNVIICEYAFIGGGSIILKGVTIGKNSVVAAGSVVTKSIPENEIWGGNPAKFIRKLEPVSRSREFDCLNYNIEHII